MKTIYTNKHKGHATDSVIYDGTPFITEEVPARAEIILKAIQTAKVGEVVSPMDYGLEPILAVHDPGYIEYLRTAFDTHQELFDTQEPVIPHTFAVSRRARKPNSFLGLRGYYSFGTGTPILEGTWEAAYWSAQTAITGAQAILDGETSCYALCRPPGHHAAADLYDGSCFLNNAAIAASYLLQHAQRVAILDIDYHHGNGTQEIFYTNPAVVFCSIHGHPDHDYPYFWGMEDETGEGAGMGTNHNFPLPRGAEDQTYLNALDKALQIIRNFQPEVLVVSTGFDLMKDDPIGGFNISFEGLARISSEIARLNLPTLIVQEGGYLMEQLGGHAVTFLLNFQQEKI